MNTVYRLSYLMVVTLLSLSCAEQKTAEEKINSPALTDTLRFTSAIVSVFQDSKGHYWLGSQREGVCRFDGKSFQYFTTDEGLPDNQVFAIQEDRHGIIWFDTPKGVASYDGQTITKHTERNNRFAQNHWLDTADRQAGWPRTEMALWFGAGTKEGVYRYDGQNLAYLAFPNPKGSHTGNSYAVTGFSKGRNNRQWISTYAGVFGYDGHELIVINDETLGLTEASGQLHVRSIFEDSQGRLWIGNNGIGVMLKEGESVINFSREQGKLVPMDAFRENTATGQFSKNTGLQSVFAIAEDRDGNIWFGDRDTGAWQYDGHTLTNYSTIDKHLRSPMVCHIYKDHNHRMLFGMAGGGVYQFNGQSFEKVF